MAELPQFHLLFQNRDEMEIWKRALLDLNPSEAPILSPAPSSGYGESEDEGLETGKPTRRISSNQSSWEATKSNMTAPTEYSNMNASSHTLPIASHVPLDVVVVIPVSSSMQGLKIHVLKDALRFLVQNLGDRDRMGLVTFGSSGGGVPLVGMTNKAWPGWQQVLSSIRPVGQKSLRADVVEGANVAMDLLMQRKSHNPLASILLISDAASTDGESVDFVISRAEAAK